MAVYGSGVASQTIDYLGSIEPATDLPNAPVNEMMYAVIEASEEDFNKIMMECGVRELAYVEENHTEMVYEASGISKMVDDVKGWFEKMWARIKKMINDALDKIADNSVKFRKNILSKLNKDFLRKRLENIEANKNFGTRWIYGDIGAKSKKIIDALNDAENSMSDDAEKINTQVKDGETNLGDVDGKFKEHIKGALKGVTGGDKSYGSSTANIADSDFSVSSAKAVMMKYMRGNQEVINGAQVKSNFNEWLEEVEKFPKTKRDLKKSYAEVKSSINKSIAKIKKYDSNSKLFEPSVFSKMVKYMKTLKQLVAVCQQAVISCVNEREAFYRSVIVKVIGTKPVKESTDYFSESSTNDTISSMFEW